MLLLLLSDHFLEETRPYHFFSYASLGKTFTEETRPHHFFSYASLGKTFTETVYREERKPAQYNRFLFEVLNTFITVTSNSQLFLFSSIVSPSLCCQLIEIGTKSCQLFIRPVVRRLISANLGVNFDPSFFYSFVQRQLTLFFWSIQSTNCR